VRRSGWLKPSAGAARFGAVWRGPIAAVVFFTGLAVTIARGADGDAERVVRYADDQLTVRLARAPVGEVLGEIGRQSGAEIRGEPNPREVTAEFENVPLLDALHRLLGNQNFMLKYGEKSRLVAIDLLAGEGAPPGTTPVAARVSSTTTMPQPPQQTLQEALQRFPAVPIAGALAGALGTNTATIDQLVNTALHHDDAGVRAEALRTTLNAVESDATLRGSLLATVNSIDDVALTASLRGIAGDRAEELAAHVATQARASELRVKASSVLQQIRAQGAAGHPGG